MAKRYVLFWFDVEDCTVTQSDDAAKRIAQILTRHGVRGTMKLVGQKARMLRQRVRYDVIDALGQHAIGYHTDWHGLRPQPAEYMGPLDWLAGGAEFCRRERRGLDEIDDLWGCVPVCYGQPGSNWSAQVFPVLRQWGIRTYVSGFGYVGLYAQPFWYGGLINTSHMHGRDRQGREARHAFGLNFELGASGALAEHQRQFAASYDALKNGGLISIMNHPCTLVLKEWFSTDMKSAELTAAGYEHFEAFVSQVMDHEEIEAVSAERLPELYPDRARNRIFSRDELLALARAVGDQVHFQEVGDISLTAAELFGMFARFLCCGHSEQGMPVGATCRYLDGPALSTDALAADFTATAADFIASVKTTVTFLDRTGRLPEVIQIGQQQITPDDYYCALARTVAEVIDRGQRPQQVRVSPAENLLAQYVDENAAASAWRSAMMRPGFAAPKLLEQAYLQAWTLKPAILSTAAR